MNQGVLDIQFVRDLIAEFKNLGVTQVVVCAGARNALWVKLVSQDQSLQIWSYPEERAAAFFALGLAKQSELPVVVITTSGTAVAECYPAVIEAHYQQLPLWIVSADRPKSYRGTGAPQAIEQSHLFANYAPCWDWDASQWNDLAQVTPIPQGPIQFNICLEDPKALLARVNEFNNPVTKYKLTRLNPQFRVETTQSLELVKNPILLLAPLTYHKHRDLVRRWLKQHRIYFYLEGASGLFDSEILNSPCRILDLAQLSSALEGHTSLNWSLVKVGNTPLVSWWRSVEQLKNLQQIYCFNEFEYSGLPSNPIVKKVTLSQLETFKFINQPEFDKYLQQNLVPSELKPVLNLEERLFAKIKQRGKGQRFFIGNSLPIRHWDRVEPMIEINDFWAYRGANGIDGQLSGFLGWCSHPSAQSISHAIVGDLTALYDLQSLWVTKQLQARYANLTIVIWIIQNKGGRIFDALLKDELYRNSHELEFEYWAKMFAVPYKKAISVEQIEAIYDQLSLGLQIVEVQVDR